MDHLLFISVIVCFVVTLTAKTKICFAFSSTQIRRKTGSFIGICSGRLSYADDIIGVDTASKLHARAKSKWDNLVDEDEYEYDEDGGGGGGGGTSDRKSNVRTQVQVSSDMTYVERNVKRAHETFLNLRNIGGKDVCHDVYAKSPTSDLVMFYVGKVAKVSDVALEDCIARQWNMIEHHSSNLRPIELKPHRGRIELWTAPGDSELDVAYNRPDLKMMKMKNYALTNKEVNSNLIGFQGEVYQDNEEGFRTWRDRDGYAARPEINPGGETRPPTEEEYAQLQTELNERNMSVEDLYKQQERSSNE